MKNLFTIIVAIFAFSFNLYSQAIEKIDLNLSLPSQDWAINLKLINYEFNKSSIDPEAKTRNWEFVDNEEGYMLTAFLEPAQINSTKNKSEECREFYYNKLKSFPLIDHQTVKQYKIKEFEVLEYFYKSKNEKSRTKSFNLYLSKENIWVDIHLSKDNYKDSDSIEIAKLFNSITIENDYKEAIFDCFAFGGVYYLGRDYNMAARHYEAALKYEKIKKRLKKDYFLVLIDNLGMSYGVTGELDKAIQTFEFGLSNYPDYPMFHYNLACSYGEKNNLDKALEYLENVLKYKSNMIEGETMPNPIEDSSFKNFLNENKFLKIAAKFKQ
jgi:hypothetical protein